MIAAVVAMTLSGLLAATAQTAAAQATGHLDLPADMPGDRLLVLQRTPAGTALATVDAHGGDRTELTSGHADFAATWSPDGRHVAFLRVEAPTDGLYVVPATGGEARRLADRGHSPSWAPNSMRMVYSPSTEAQPEPLRIGTLDGSTTPIPGTSGGIDPVWAPDGSQIAYIDPQLDFALVLVAPDGSNRTVVDTAVSDPVWAPDSLSVVYVKNSDGHARLLRSDSAGSEVYVVTAEMRGLQQPAFSPAGDRVAFTAPGPGGDLDVWTAGVADGHLQRLTTGQGDDFGPTWSPSARTIAFSRSAAIASPTAPTDVWAVPADGGAGTRATSTGGDHVVAFAPGRTLRLAGVHTRIHTAVALSRTFSAASTVVIARADVPADALAGAPLAALLDAPLLLTGPDGLDPVVAAEIDRLGAEQAYVLGGSAALSAQVDRDLEDGGVFVVRRLPGAARFHTAAMVADELRDLTGEAPQRVFVVEGLHADPARGWPDALSASGVAALDAEPVLLVSRDVLPAVTADTLRGLDPEQVLVVGGTAAVSEAVQGELAGLADDVARVAGQDRYATSALLADLAVVEGADPARPWLATGRSWPDALAAVPAATRDGGVLLLVDGSSPDGAPASHRWLVDHDVRRAVVVGGTAAIQPRVRAAAEGAIDR